MANSMNDQANISRQSGRLFGRLGIGTIVVVAALGFLGWKIVAQSRFEFREVSLQEYKRDSYSLPPNSDKNENPKELLLRFDKETGDTWILNLNVDSMGLKGSWQPVHTRSY
jgi:hypothetical protein